jgi:hypothetical protein
MMVWEISLQVGGDTQFTRKADRIWMVEHDVIGKDGIHFSHKMLHSDR